MVSYHLPGDNPVRLDIHDVLGKLVATLVDCVQSQGHHRIVWGGRDSSGRAVADRWYIYHLDIDHHSLVRRVHRQVSMAKPSL